MTHVPRKPSGSGIYHVTARGVGRQLLFEDDDDRRRFAESLLRTKTDCFVEVLAWCLMDNHIHLLLRGELEQVSRMMRRLLGSYAMGFNLSHGRVGHLFQDRFHSTPVEDDEQLLAALRYIHLNPLDMGYDYRDYPWSSYMEYESGESSLADTGLVAEIVGGMDAFRSLHEAAGDTYGMPGAGGPRRRLSSGEAGSVVREVLGDVSPYDLKALGKDERNAYIARLRGAGLSVRQIERLTGIGRGIISRVKS